MSATWRLLPRIDEMMFGLTGLVKRALVWTSAKREEGSVFAGPAGVAVGKGGRSALSIAP